MSRATYVYIVLKRCNILTAKSLTPEELDNVRKAIDSLDAIIQQEVIASFTVKYEMIDYLTKHTSLNKLRIVRTRHNDEVKDVTDTIMKEVKAKIEECPNCKEPLNDECACMRNLCIDCGDPVGNITFSKCDKCF